jgi:hypothetical protein
VNMEPVTSEIPSAGVCALGPAFATAGAKETVTLLEELVPTGKPEPVTRMSCTFGWPALGYVADPSFTCACVVEVARRNTRGTTLNRRQDLRALTAR